MRNAIEHAEQAMFVQWLDTVSGGEYPELAAGYAVPNAAARSEAEGARMKREGLRTGMLDFVIPLPRSGYGALYIEFKRGADAKLTPLQLARAELLAAVGNRVERADSCSEAIEITLAYIAGPGWNRGTAEHERVRAARATIMRLEDEGRLERAKARIRRAERDARAAAADPETLLEIAQRTSRETSGPLRRVGRRKR